MPPTLCPYPFTLTDADHERYASLYAAYQQMADDPANSTPRFVIDTPTPSEAPTMAQRLADPMVMLTEHLMRAERHRDIGDDALPFVRVEYGTPQVAWAFGCGEFFPEGSLPAAHGHPIDSIEQVYELKKPDVHTGHYARIADIHALWRKVLPKGVHIQHPDIQSAFNTAHLIRGDDIFLDLIENPEAVEHLLDVVIDFMIELTPHLRGQITNLDSSGVDHDQWFLDYPGLWRGRSRISNCSMQMISPRMYLDHVLPRDQRYFDATGGGRVHYCGLSKEVIAAFTKLDNVHGLDADAKQHGLWDICEMIPEDWVFMCWVGWESDTVRRLLAGDWPIKRNLIIRVGLPSVEAGRAARQCAGLTAWRVGVDPIARGVRIVSKATGRARAEDQEVSFVSLVTRPVATYSAT